MFDTPGFSYLSHPEVEKEELHKYFSEFLSYEGQCKYLECSHIHEPGCVVQDALERGEICKSRYENYVQTYEELSELERRRNRRAKK